MKQAPRLQHDNEKEREKASYCVCISGRRQTPTVVMHAWSGEERGRLVSGVKGEGAAREWDREV